MFMKAALSWFQSKSTYDKALHWAKLISVTGGTQVAVQAIGFISGILVIRLLPTQEYALYTLTNTMLGTMILLADGGISTSVMAQGGKVWQNRERLGMVLATGFALRKKFAIVSLGIAIPALLFLLRHHQASWPMAIWLVLALIPAFFSSLSGTLLEIVPKLNQHVIPLQRIQLGNYAGRLGLLVLNLFTFPWAPVAILAAGLPQLWANKQLRTLSGKFAVHTQQTDPTVHREIVKNVKRLLPDAIYYCIWCQFAVWLISFFGSTEAVAHLGALGRLAVALTLFSVMFSSLILPRFARLPDQRVLLLRQFVRIEVGLLITAVCIVAGVYVFSTQILWVLGPSYKNLAYEMTLMMIGKCLSFVATSSFLLCTSKGWVINPVVSISISIASFFCGIGFIDITSLRGIFMLDIFMAVVQVIMHITYAVMTIRKTADVDAYPVNIVA